MGYEFHHIPWHQFPNLRLRDNDFVDRQHLGIQKAMCLVFADLAQKRDRRINLIRNLDVSDDSEAIDFLVEDEAERIERVEREYEANKAACQQFFIELPHNYSVHDGLNMLYYVGMPNGERGRVIRKKLCYCPCGPVGRVWQEKNNLTRNIVSCCEWSHKVSTSGRSRTYWMTGAQFMDHIKNSQQIVHRGLYEYFSVVYQTRECKGKWSW